MQRSKLEVCPLSLPCISLHVTTFAGAILHDSFLSPDKSSWNFFLFPLFAIARSARADSFPEKAVEMLLPSAVPASARQVLDGPARFFGWAPWECAARGVDAVLFKFSGGGQELSPASKRSHCTLNGSRGLLLVDEFRALG